MKHSFFQRTFVVFLLALFSLSFSRDLPWNVFHNSWDIELKKYVKEGKVNYQAWAKKPGPLKDYLERIERISPNHLDSASREDSLALYINAYNAYTIDIMLKHIGINSIRDIKPNAWKQKFVVISDELMTLDHLEHNIIRPKFDEPLIHFAIVCASISCPPLVEEAYTKENVMELMEQNTRAYLADPEQNIFTGKKYQISKLFQWFKSDFEKDGNTVKSFIQKYGPESYDPSKPFKYKGYDWSINSL